MWALAVFGALTLAPLAVEPNRAGPLTWDAPGGCPSAEQVMAAAGGGLEASRGVEARARVIRPDAHRWLLDLSVQTSTGRLERWIDADSCEQLAELTGFVVAMHTVGAHADMVRQAQLQARPETQRPREGVEVEGLPPIADAEHPPPESPDVTSTAAPDFEVPELHDVYVVDPEQEARRNQTPLRAGLSTYTGVGFGALPTVDVPLGLGIALLAPRFRAQLSGMYWVEQNEAVAEGGSVSVSMWSARVAVGPSFAVGRRIEIPVLMAAELGSMAAQGHGFEQTRRQAAAWAAAGLAPGVSIRLHRLIHIWAEVYGFATLYRPQFYVYGVGRVHHAAPGGGRVALGVELRIPGR